MMFFEAKSNRCAWYSVADLHVHSGNSRDGNGVIGEMVEIAYQRNYKGLAVTDHLNHNPNNMSAAQKSFLDHRRPDVKVLGGIEIQVVDHSEERGNNLFPHLLIFGGSGFSLRDFLESLPGEVPTLRDIFAWVEEERQRRSVAVVVPHPDLDDADGRGLALGVRTIRVLAGLGLIDGIESLNGGFLRKYGELATAQRQQRCLELFRDLNIAFTGGSDAHCPRNVATVGTLIDGEIETPWDIVGAIRERRCTSWPRPEDLARRVFKKR